MARSHGPLDVESEGERARLGTERSRTLRALESFEEALALDLELLVLAKDRRLPTGWIHLELAECYRATGRWTQARRHFTRARDELEGDPTLSASERQRIAALAASEDGKTPDGTPP